MSKLVNFGNWFWTREDLYLEGDEAGPWWTGGFRAVI